MSDTDPRLIADDDRPTSFAMRQIPHPYKSHGFGRLSCLVCDLAEAHWAHDPALIDGSVSPE